MVTFQNGSLSYEALTAATLTSVTAISGLLLTALCCFALLCRTVFRNVPFCWLSASLSVADSGILSVFVFWTIPVTIFGQENMLSVVGRKFGQLALTCQYAVLYNMLTIAINRFVAVVKFNKYEIWFSRRRTKFMIICIWCISLTHGTLYFYPGCDFIYDHESFVWFFVETDCFEIMYAFDLYYSLLILGIILLLNVIAGLFLKQSNKTRIVAKDRSSTQTESNRQQAGAARRRKQEARFFLQTCLNVMEFAFMFVCFHLISPHAVTKIELYLTTSWIWQLSHATNAWVLFAFNKEMRRALAGIVCCFDVRNVGQTTEKETTQQQKMVKRQTNNFTKETE